jgi:hypothetical protein
MKVASHNLDTARSLKEQASLLRLACLCSAIAAGCLVMSALIHSVAFRNVSAELRRLSELREGQW